MLLAVLMSVLIPTVPSGQAIGPRIVRSLFNTDPTIIEADQVVDQFHAAGVTHLSFQLFHSPCYSKIATLPDFQADYDRTIYPKIQWCIDRGFRVTGMLDETLRIVNGSTAAMDWLHHSPIALDCIGYAAQRAGESGVVDSVRVVDESQPPATYAPVQPFVDRWRAAGGPPLSWPNIAPMAWETPALSDQSARYWTAWSSGDYPFARQAALIQQGATRVRKDRPWSCLLWCCGPQWQVKGASKFRFNSGVQAKDIAAQAALALAFGCSEFDLYGYDWSIWRDNRANGQGLLQTGSRPGDDRWGGVITAFSEIMRREKTLLRTPYVPTTRGHKIWGRRGEAPDAIVWEVDTRTAAVKWWNLLELLRPGAGPAAR